ncbi:MAG: hypothetical protein QOG53_3104 [Frankiales bacterium]|jgi:hypothetical protein|nr:hypothetical protein [Frankiales bacterium]
MSRDGLLVTRFRARSFEGTPHSEPGVRDVGTCGNPPPLAVHHYLGRVTVNHCPVCIWRVGDVEKFPQEDQVSGQSSTRAVAVRVVEELPTWLHFEEVA